eukprot:XP_015581341.1 uncharacterized protein LOC8266306 [Ricinus communis]
MWAVIPLPHRLQCSFIQKQPPVFLGISANSQPSSHRYTSTNKKQRQKLQKQDEEKQKERGAVTNQLSGIDVLWAMQKAAAEKNRTSNSKRNRKRDGLISASGQKEKEKEKDAVDYSNVRPLCIKSDWGPRLDRLEKRLNELSGAK